MTASSPFDLKRRLFSELLGTALLVAVVVGSGIMGENLAGGNETIALLGNTLATGAVLVVLILIFGPISGAHFNPVVSLSFAVQRKLPWLEFLVYTIVQIIGGIAGVMLAHIMFSLPLISACAGMENNSSKRVKRIFVFIVFFPISSDTQRTQKRILLHTWSPRKEIFQEKSGGSSYRLWLALNRLDKGNDGLHIMKHLKLSE